MIIEAKPHVIVISGNSYKAIQIRNAICALLNDIQSAGFPLIKVEVLPNYLSTVYAKGKICTTREREYSNRSEVFREAQSIGRLIQNPIFECCQLFNENEDILEVLWHPLQNKVSRKKFLKCLQNEVITLVNTIGLDLSKVITNEHMTHALQFIGGMTRNTSKMFINVFREFKNGNDDSIEILTQMLLRSVEISTSTIKNCLQLFSFKSKPVDKLYKAKECRNDFNSLDGFELFEAFTKQSVSNYIGKIVRGTVIGISWRKEKIVILEDRNLACYFCKRTFGDKKAASLHFSEQLCVFGVIGLRVAIEGLDFNGFAHISNVSTTAFPSIEKSLNETTEFRIMSFSPFHLNFSLSNKLTDIMSPESLTTIQLDPYFNVDSLI